MPRMPGDAGLDRSLAFLRGGTASSGAGPAGSAPMSSRPGAGHRLYARIGGPARPSGPPVLLLSGFMPSGRYLEPMAAELASDPPGAGRSPHGETPRTLPDLADLVAD